MVDFKLARLLGRLANGFESDKGKLVHAVALMPAKRPPCPFNDFGKKVIPNDDFQTWKSLCGKVPGKRSVGWDYDVSEKIVTCEKCLGKLKNMGESHE